MKEKLKNFSFTSHFKIFALISALFVSVGIVGLILTACGVQNVFNFDIDFIGGTTMSFDLHQSVDKNTTDDVEALFREVTGTKPSSVITSGEQSVTVKSLELNDQQRLDVVDAMTEKYGLSNGDYQIDYVSASVSGDLARSAVIASVLAVVLILVYIAIRFEFKSGIAAICALVHDLLAMLSMYIIFRIPFNINFIAAALTILGYSINATIVVFDRVRENKRLDASAPFAQIVDTSIWQTMTRSLNTTITTLLVMVVLLILGVSSIKNFALPLCIGVVCGCYSSVCISGPVWNLLASKKHAKA